MRVPAMRMDGVWDQRTRFALGGLLVCVVLSMGVGVYRDRHLVAPPTPLKITYYDGSVPSSAENQILGTRNWQLTAGTDTTFIEGYADKASALPGDQVQLFISAARPTSYDIEIYRMGWYYGLGARLYSHAHISNSQQQGNWAKGALHDCQQCTTDSRTHLLAANWQPSYSFDVGKNWVSGVYLIKLRAPQGESYIPLVVKESADPAVRHSEVLVSLPVMTYQAENAWGGASFYGRDTGKGIDLYNELDPNRATKLSFDRPYANDAGAGDLLSYDLHAVRWLERAGFDVSYTTDLDVDADAQSLLQHVAFVALGHDEYWTKAMRDGLEHARDAGVSLGFFGAQDGYWQARLADDRRTIVCYKVGTGIAPELDASEAQLASPTNDPDYANPKTRGLTTARWRDTILNRPENELLGIQFDGFIFRVPPTNTYLPDWKVRSGDLDSLTRNSTFSPGEAVSGGLLGYAYDALGNNGQTPLGLTLLGQSSVVDNLGAFRIANTTYYRAQSNAIVFDAGSVWWSWALDEFTFQGANHPNMLLGSEHTETLNTNMLRMLMGAGHVPPPASQPIQGT